MRTYIGIDAGQHTGVAVWDGKQFLSIVTTDFWGAVSVIEQNPEATIYIEDPSQNRPVFGLLGLYSKTVGSHVQKLSALAKVAQNVGGVKRESELLIEYCKQKKIKFVAVKPTKNSMTKLTAEKFRQITGYTARTSEHGRDAAMMIYDR